MKKIFSVMLSLLLILAVCPLAQAAGKAKSGDLNGQPLTQEAIQAKLDAVSLPSAIFDQRPSVKAPYSAGKLADSFLENGLSYLNLYRYLAHLPEVGMEASLNDSAQHGAVVMAANDQLSHYPSRPADMPEDFYQKGSSATSSSNIHYNFGYSANSSLHMAVSGFMQDTGSLQNLSCLGHRRWILNPTLGNVGFGYAVSSSSSNYVALKVFDRSGRGADYDFISWPASGKFPLACFDTSTPWSVTLNPAKYQTPSKGSVVVTITGLQSGTVWRFDSSTSGPASHNDDAKKYFTVDNNGYGVSNCLIFNPGSGNVRAYSGTYTVKIEGLKDSGGAATSLEYDVEFFKSGMGGGEEGPCDHEYDPEVTLPTCTEQGYTTYTCVKCGESYKDDFTDPLDHTWGEWTVEGELESRVCTVCGEKETREPGFPFTDVLTTDYFYEPVKWAAKNGIASGTSDTTFSPGNACTRAQAVTFLWRAANCPNPQSGVTPFVDIERGSYYEKAVLWAVEQGITAGKDFTHFGPDEKCTRAQIVSFLHRAAGEPAAAVSNAFADVKDGAYYQSAVNWAVGKGIAAGMDKTHFSPAKTCTRGQIVSFLYRNYEQ